MYVQITSPTRSTCLCLAALSIGLVCSAPAGATVMGEDLKLLAGDGEVGDQFGFSVAIRDGIIAVGAPSNDENGVDSGSAYLFDAMTGDELWRLTPDDGASGDGFGYSIDMADGIVAVGARLEDENGADAGAAYLFSVSTGEQLMKLLPGDGAAGDEFGTSIAIDDGTVAVGAMRDDDLGDASGSVYLFDASTGEEIDKLLPAEGAANQNFGVSMAMDGDVLAIGARAYFVLGEGFVLGTVYLFDVTTGDLVDELVADNGSWTDMFGDAVDIDGGTVVVGAPGRSVFFDHSGAAYLFDAATGSQLAYFYPADGHDRDHFGTSVSIHGVRIAIGAHKDGDRGWDAGSAYLYDTADVTLVHKLLMSDGAEFDRFGTAIALEGGTVASGATGFGTSGTETGYVGVFGGETVLAADGAPGVRPVPLATPNPFRTSTTFSAHLDTPGRVVLNIFSPEGRQVRSLVNGELAAGTHRVAWDGRDAHGRALPAGVYFVRLRLDGESRQGRLVFRR